MRPTDNPNKTSVLTPPYTWVDAVMMLVQAPDTKTMKRILSDTSMTAQRAYFWVLISGIFIGIALAGVYRPSELINALLIGLPGINVDGTSYQPDLLTIILSGVTLGAMHSVIGFIVQTWLLQRVGTYFNATGKYSDIAILRGVYYPVILVTRAMIIALLGYNSLASNILIFGTLLADFSLAALAISASNDLTWRQGLMIVAGMNAGLLFGLIILSVFGLLIG